MSESKNLLIVGEVPPQNFHSSFPAEQLVAGKVDNPHSTFAEPSGNLVCADYLAYVH